MNFRGDIRNSRSINAQWYWKIKILNLQKGTSIDLKTKSELQIGLYLSRNKTKMFPFFHKKLHSFSYNNTDNKMP